MKILDLITGNGSGWVMVFPRGKHYINKYELILDCNDKFFGTVKEWWENSTFKKPYLDKGHEFNERYGEFTDMRVTDKGLEMFLVLNDEGKKLLKDGTYTYLSPTFTDAADSNGKSFQNVVYTVSLVNSPALLVLDKIQNQIALSAKGEKEPKIKQGGFNMDLRELIAGKMKLDLAANDSSILAKIDELINSGATIEELKIELEKMKGALQTATDELTVMKDEKQKAMEALEAIQKETIKSEASGVIDLAIKDGQYHPAMKDFKVAQYIEKKEEVLKELSLIPKVKTNIQQMTIANSEKTFDISEENKAILLDAGYDLEKPEDMKLAQKFLESLKEDK